VRALVAVAALALIAATPFQPPESGARVIYRHATLIDATVAGKRADMAVITDGERIKAVLPDRDLTPAQLEDAELVDLTGRYLLPGFVDTHVHVATPPDRPLAEARLKRFIYSGVTATRDMADDLRNLADIARAARVGEIPSPDIYYAALVAGPTFFDDPRTQAVAQGAVAGQTPWMQAIDAQTDLRTAVTLARGTSATAIKIYANLPGSLVSAITAEAHRQGVPVWAHGMVFPATPREVVDAGADTVSHTCYLGYQAMTQRPQRYQDRSKIAVDASLFQRDNPVMTALFADMKRRGTILDATVFVYQFAEKREKEAGRTPFCTEALAAKLTNHAYRSGVKISTGTDADTPPASQWPGLFDEFELLAGPAGMAPADVIRAATLTGAEAMNQARDMGTIEPGKLANLVVLTADPLASAKNLRSVELTVKRGRRFARADYAKP
jgi:imidazolonepropionase-like amidohydrolase